MDQCVAKGFGYSHFSALRRERQSGRHRADATTQRPGLSRDHRHHAAGAARRAAAGDGATPRRRSGSASRCSRCGRTTAASMSHSATARAAVTTWWSAPTAPIPRSAICCSARPRGRNTPARRCGAPPSAGRRRCWRAYLLPRAAQQGRLQSGVEVRRCTSTSCRTCRSSVRLA